MIPPKIGVASSGGCLLSKNQISRHPESQSAERESHCRLRETIDHERTIPEQCEVISFRGAALSFRQAGDSSRSRIPLPETGEPKNDSGNGDQIKRPAPAELMIDDSAENVSERAAHRDRAAKNRHDPAAHLERKIIRQNCGRGGPVAALADADENSGDEQGGKRCGETRSGSCETPENHAHAHDEPARESIGEKTEDRRRDHVGEEKCRSQRAGAQHRIGIVRSEKRRANIRFDRGQNEPVDVVKKIDREEQSEGEPRAGFRGGIVRRHRINNCTELPRPCKP